MLLGLLGLWSVVWAQGAGTETAAPTTLELQRQAVEKQRESVRRQVQQKSVSSGFFIVEWQSPAAEPRFEDPDGDGKASPPKVDGPKPECPPLTPAEKDKLLKEKSAKHAVDEGLLRAVVEQESGFRACATSHKGAMGLMQLMPATAATFRVEDPYDPAQNMEAGTRYLRQLLDQYGDVELALSAYNAGPGRVKERVPAIAETQNYVASIMGRWRRAQLVSASGTRDSP